MCHNNKKKKKQSIHSDIYITLFIHSNIMSDLSDFDGLDKNSLLSLVIEKDKRIQDLEQLVEDQKRLRLQDSNQVEEKAARIKEWVTNKLKELENQNKQLRDQNRRQKEMVESLSMKLASMSPISSPRKKLINSSLEKVQYIDQAQSPTHNNKKETHESLKIRRPQLKKLTLHQPQMNMSSLEDDDQNLRIRLTPSMNELERGKQFEGSRAGGISFISIGDKSSSPANNVVHQSTLPRQESPLYDSVNFELVNNQNRTQNDNKSPDEPLPPPPPLHQSDRWELQLYKLAEQTFSSMMQDLDHNDDLSDHNSASNKQSSRESSGSLRNDIISVVQPSFTTIDGDQVVDNNNIDTEIGADITGKGHRSGSLGGHQRNSEDQSSQHSNHVTSRNYKDITSTNQDGEQKVLAQNLFDSPIRSRSSKDSILRTQSVRKNPAPEKLYDFISSDLVKRGYLIKHGALRSHSRWFVLKNFHLYTYKREAEETAKAAPSMTLKLEPSFQIQVNGQSNDGFQFKINYQDKNITLIAESAHVRDEWVRMLTVTINLSDIEPVALTKQNSSYEGLLSVTRHGHTKRCHASLVNHVVFFLKSPIDPTPMSYLSVKGSKIREITDSQDYDPEEQEFFKQRNSSLQDCSLAIYPKFATNLDPVYLTLSNQQEMDGWFHFLSNASGVDQSSGTPFERTLTRIMISNSMQERGGCSFLPNPEPALGCVWKEHPIMLFSDRSIQQPLTSLPNETLKAEAIELFKSILLFTQVPLEPIAIDYHVCLLQNCLSRFLKYPELRNEFFAQLIKQSTYILHRCYSSKLSSSGSSGCSSINQRSSVNSLSPSSSECQFVTDVQLLSAIAAEKYNYERNSTNSVIHQLNRSRDKYETSPQPDESNPPSQSELMQVMQILAIAVALNLPRGRLRWWLIDHLKKFSNTETNMGKYALFTLRAIDRTMANGARDNVPSRTEIMGILLRNPYNYSTPHSLPVTFSDGSYLVVGADGSTTVEEFMATMGRSTSVRHSPASDFYLFTDDPCKPSDLHILEPQRKVLDVVGWWEHTFRQHNSGRNQNTRVIKLTCKKRLLLRPEENETEQERLLIVYQMNQEINSGKIPLSDALALELSQIMSQLTSGDSDKTSGRTAQDCVRVYLNCIRRLMKR